MNPPADTNLDHARDDLNGEYRGDETSRVLINGLSEGNRVSAEDFHGNTEGWYREENRPVTKGWAVKLSLAGLDDDKGGAFMLEAVHLRTLTKPDRAIRLAAVADWHVRHEVRHDVLESLEHLPQLADALLIAGDITDQGRLIEFERAADALRPISIPKIAVLGNHDRRCLRRKSLRRILESAGVILLDGDATTLELALQEPSGAPSVPVAPSTAHQVRIGLAGVGGYGGGFWPEESDQAPPLARATQAVALRARREAIRLRAAIELIEPDVDLRVVLLHYSPTVTTLGREPLVKHFMLGNVELARVIDQYPVDLVIHGHAHLGNPYGRTIGGTPVRNVANHVVGRPVICELPVPLAHGMRIAE